MRSEIKNAGAHQGSKRTDSQTDATLKVRPFLTAIAQFPNCRKHVLNITGCALILCLAGYFLEISYSDQTKRLHLLNRQGISLTIPPEINKRWAIIDESIPNLPVPLKNSLPS